MIETRTPWHISPHGEGEQYMQCTTFKEASKGRGSFITTRYVTAVTEILPLEGISSQLMTIETIVPPQASWIKVHGGALGVPEPKLRQPPSLQDLAHRVVDKSTPKGPKPKGT